MNKKHAIIASVLVMALVTTTAAFSQQDHTQHSQTVTTLGSYTPHHGPVVIMHITSGEPDDPHQVHKATMGVDHALTWHRQGMKVAIFLDAEGVLIGAEEVPTELAGINKNLKQFLAEGGRVIACSHCVMMHDLEPEDMLPSIEIDTHPNMSRIQELLRSGATVLDY